MGVVRKLYFAVFSLEVAWFRNFWHDVFKLYLQLVFIWFLIRPATRPLVCVIDPASQTLTILSRDFFYS